jgi:Family of unknown function (DUF6390)
MPPSRQGQLASGETLFARYAFPPNELGYCGPADPELLIADPAAAARQFEGAWVYQELIAAAAGVADPMDARVVEAYWVGNDLLDGVDPVGLTATLAERFAGQLIGPARRLWDRRPAASALAHHSFHVFAVYPWLALLPAGKPGGVPLSVLDSCRIRWGTVVGSEGERVLVRSRPLTWDGARLALGADRVESVRWSDAGFQRDDALQPGEFVACHWDWICDRLTEEQLHQLATRSAHQLDAANPPTPPFPP